MNFTIVQASSHITGRSPDLVSSNVYAFPFPVAFCTVLLLTVTGSFGILTRFPILPRERAPVIQSVCRDPFQFV